MLNNLGLGLDVSLLFFFVKSVEKGLDFDECCLFVCFCFLVEMFLDSR